MRVCGRLIVRAGAREANRQGGCAGGESSGRAGSVCWRTQGGQKAPRMPKRQPEGEQKAPLMPKRHRKGCQTASKGTPKPQKNESEFSKRFGRLKRVLAQTFCLPFGSILGPFWEPKSMQNRIKN